MAKRIAKMYNVGGGWKRLMDDGTYRPYRWYHNLIDKLWDYWNSRHWRKRQREFKRTDTRYYGNGGTIHSSGHVDVEVNDGKVVSVWFRCQPLPFKQTEVEIDRAAEMRSMYKNPPGILCGVEIKDE